MGQLRAPVQPERQVGRRAAASLDDRGVSASWNAEYRTGRYRDEPPLPFVRTILAHAAAPGRRRHAPGLYVGCGNGRNFVPLVDAGLDLYGLDVSVEALRQLAERRPDVSRRLVCADFLGFDARRPFGSLIAIQVFQHGTATDVVTYFERAASLLVPGGLLCVRVNSAATLVRYTHDVIEENDLGGFTVRYLDGPKRGLPVHFYAHDELMRLTREAFTPVGEPREEVIPRAAPADGSWAQWEMIWERR